VFLGALRAGVAVAPLAPSSTAEQLAGMVVDADARRFFLDAGRAADAQAAAAVARAGRTCRRPAGALAGCRRQPPAPVAIDPAWPFNIIYSSGTTGTPKGIVQSHAMRWAHMRRGRPRLRPDSVTLIATPLYSNTTLVSVIPHAGLGRLRGADAEVRRAQPTCNWRSAHAPPTPCWCRCSTSG
jgi:long-chain acyl-CoA synthetase